MQAAVISKKNNYQRVTYKLWTTPICIFIRLLIKQTFEKNKWLKTGSDSWVQFWSRMTPDYKKPLIEIKNESTIIQKLSVKLDSSWIFLWLVSSDIKENLGQYSNKQQIWKTLSKFLFVISCTIPFSWGWAKTFSSRPFAHF